MSAAAAKALEATMSSWPVSFSASESSTARFLSWLEGDADLGRDYSIDQLGTSKARCKERTGVAVEDGALPLLLLFVGFAFFATLAFAV